MQKMPQQKPALEEERTSKVKTVFLLVFLIYPLSEKLKHL
jgi:hypothetical protein